MHEASGRSDHQFEPKSSLQRLRIAKSQPQLHLLNICARLSLFMGPQPSADARTVATKRCTPTHPTKPLVSEAHKAATSAVSAYSRHVTASCAPRVRFGQLQALCGRQRPNWDPLTVIGHTHTPAANRHPRPA